MKELGLGAGAGGARTRSPKALRMKSHLAEESREGNLKKKKVVDTLGPGGGTQKRKVTTASFAYFNI